MPIVTSIQATGVTTLAQHRRCAERVEVFGPCEVDGRVSTVMNLLKRQNRLC